MKNYTTITDSQLRDLRSEAADLEWAHACEAGSYLHHWEDDGLDDVSDSGSRGGRSDAELDDLERVLRRRGLTLVADDRGLCAERA